jgi:transcriptional regulator with XRE-family HTH domain
MRGLAVNRNSINRESRVVTVRQIKAARALLAWSQADLARESGVSEPTIARLESSDGPLGGREATAIRLCDAIEAAGVEFLNENGGGPGVRLRKRRDKRAK